MSKEKRFLVSDESINCYGFVVRTAGIKLKNFLANPVGFFNHNRGDFWDGNKENYQGPIIRWEETSTEKNALYSTPIFDLDDTLGAAINRKVENDFIRAASIGLRIIATSNDPADMVPGQTGPTVTECELIEISVVDVPANKAALALYDKDGKQIELNDSAISVALSAGLSNNTPPKKENMKNKVLAAWTAVAVFLGLEQGKDHEVEITPEKLADLNAKLVKLGEHEATITSLTAEKTTLSASVTTLTSEKENLNGQVTTLTAEKTTLTGEVTTLKADAATKDAEIVRLTAEVKRLGGPATPPAKPVKEGNDTGNPELTDAEKETMTDVDKEARALHAKYGKKAVSAKV